MKSQRKVSDILWILVQSTLFWDYLHVVFECFLLMCSQKKKKIGVLSGPYFDSSLPSLEFYLKQNNTQV